MSGSINGDAAVEMKVTKVAKDSEYQSIVALVKSSEAKPAKFVKMADRYAVPFTIISLIIGIAAMITSAVTNPALGWQAHFLRFACYGCCLSLSIVNCSTSSNGFRNELNVKKPHYC